MIQQPNGFLTETLAEYGAKQFATLQARAALHGVALEALSDARGRPAFIATQGVRTRPLASLCEAREWLDRVEAGLTCAATGGSDE
jgi:hypothetical protein